MEVFFSLGVLGEEGGDVSGGEVGVAVVLLGEDVG